MPIQEKPFNWDHLISQVVFLGRPAYFNAIDLNRQFEVYREFQNKLNGLLGYASTSKLSVSGLSFTGSTLTFNWSRSSGHVYAAGVRFPVTAGSGSFSQSASAVTTADGKQTAPPAVYFVLTATQVRKTFSDDPVMCGLLSDEYPQRVPSADHMVYQNPQVVVSMNPSAISNKICILGTVLPYVTQGGTWDYRLFENAVVPSGPLIQSSTSYNEVVFQSNSSLMEEVQTIKMNMANNGNLTALEQRLAAAEAMIEVLKKTKEEFPVRTVLKFAGSLVEYFDTNGLGIVGKAWGGWALANGNNGTDDMRGYVPLGYDERSYATPRSAGPSQVNYGAIGNTGGQISVALEVRNMPPHKHTTNAGKQEGEATNDGSGHHVQKNDSPLAETGVTGGEGGRAVAHENRQPYFVIAYVQKIQEGAGGGGGEEPGDGGGSDTTNYYELGYDAGKLAGQANDPQLNQCPVGFSASQCFDYQSGYNAGYSDGQYNYQNYQRRGYDDGKAAGSANMTYAEVCPVDVTGDNCVMYKAGYKEGYNEWNQYYQIGYSGGAYDGYNGVANNYACPVGYTTGQCTVYQRGYQVGFKEGIRQRG